jgi:hypothetical protein
VKPEYGLAGFFDVFPRLEKHLDQLAGTMSVGEHVAFSIGREPMAQAQNGGSSTNLRWACGRLSSGEIQRYSPDQ